MTAKAHQVNYAGSLQDAQPVAQCDAHEDVARKERCLKLHTAVFPTAFALICRQEVLYRAFSQLDRDALFMIGTDVHCIPTELERNLRQTWLRAKRSGRRHGCYLFSAHRQLRPVTYRVLCDLTP